MKTNKTILTTLVALTIGGLVGVASAADATAKLDFKSAYVFRGETLNSGWVAQPDMEIGGEGLAGFTLEVWGNLDLESDDARRIDAGQFSQINLYASYEVPMNVEDVTLSLGYTEYTYPTQVGVTLAADGTALEGGAREADREINAIMEFDVVSSPYLGIFYGVDGGFEKNFYLEAGVSHSWDLEQDMSMGVGGLLSYLAPDMGNSGLNHGLIFADISWKVLTASVNYVIETDSDVLVVDEDLYFTVGATYKY